MTYAEVMALSGRELDAAVAEHVYSLEILWSDYGGEREPYYLIASRYPASPPIYHCDVELAITAMKEVLSRGAWARNLFYCTLWAQAGIPARNAANTSNPMAAEAQAARKWVEDALSKLILEDKLPEAISRAAVYVATQPQWMGSNDSNQCESGDEAEECGE